MSLETKEWVVDCLSVGIGHKALVHLGRDLYCGVLPEKDILSRRGVPVDAAAPWADQALPTCPHCGGVMAITAVRVRAIHPAPA